MRNIQTCREFLHVHLSQSGDNCRKQDFNVLEDKFCSFFYAFEIKEGSKEDSREVGGKQGGAARLES